MIPAIILQLSFDAKIPVWGIAIYIGATIWFFIKQYFKVAEHDKRLKSAEDKIVSLEKELVEKVNSLKVEMNTKIDTLTTQMNTKIDSLSNQIRDLEKSVVKLSTVVEMKLLSEMKQSKKENVG